MTNKERYAKYKKVVSENYKKAAKQLREQISDISSMNDDGYFKIPVDKIDCFYKNVVDKFKKREKIFIYGDYDVDGIGATTMMVEIIRGVVIAQKNASIEDRKKFIANNIFYKIPQRTDGYGINEKHINMIKNAGFDYLIMVDNGTHEAIKDMMVNEKNKNIENEFFVFDHHHNGDYSKYSHILNPNTDGNVSTSTGTILHIFHEKLKKRYGYNAKNLSDLGALTTISDVASLNSKLNREVIKEGLSKLGNAKSEVIKLYGEASKLEQEVIQDIEKDKLDSAKKKTDKIENIQEEIENKENMNIRSVFQRLINSRNEIGVKDLAFGIIPMFNAVSRMGENAEDIVQLLLLDYEKLNNKGRDFFDEKISFIETLNKKRKEISYDITQEVMKSLKENKLEQNPFIFIFSENIPIGINGLVASRIEEMTGKDVIVASRIKSGEKIDKIVFSGRGSNVHENLEIIKKHTPNSENIFKFGGHRVALGGGIIDLEKFSHYYKEILEKNVLVKKDSKSEFEILSTNSYVLNDSPMDIKNLMKLSEYYARKCDGIPYSKNFYASVIITPSMISNLDNVKSKMKEKEYVLLRFKQTDISGFDFENAKDMKEDGFSYIAKSDEVEKMLNMSDSEIKQGKIPAFLVELPSTYNEDNKDNALSGKIVYEKSYTPDYFVEQVAQDIKNTTKPKM